VIFLGFALALLILIVGFVVLERDRNGSKQIIELERELEKVTASERELRYNWHNADRDANIAKGLAERIVILGEYFREICDTSDEFDSDADKLELVKNLASEGFTTATGMVFDPFDPHNPKPLDTDETS